MSERFSVTEVRNAMRCPRIFALGRLATRAVAFPVGSSCLGAAFHKIVDRFASTVETPPAHLSSLARGAALDEVQSSLSSWLLGLLIDELDSDPAYAAIPGEVDDLAEALREFARHLAGRLASFQEPPAGALGQVVRASERTVETLFEAEGALVHGRLDALFADANGKLDVVEYKLTDEANDALDRAQVILYRELLRQGDGADARPVVLRFTPTLRETSVSRHESDERVRLQILPLIRSMVTWSGDPKSAPATERKDLCAACPVATDCAATFPERLSLRDDPPVGGSRPRPGLDRTLAATSTSSRPSATAEDDDGEREAEVLKQRILAELNRQGISAVSPRPATVGPTLYIMEVSRRRGAVSQLDRAADDVIHRLAAEDQVELTYEKQGGHRRFIVRRSKPQAVLLAPLLEAKRNWLAERPGRFVVGQRPDGAIVTGDLSDSSTPHLLVAGQTGSGKSIWIQSLVASLVQYHGPERIRFTLVDPKRVTFIGPAFRSAVATHLDGPIRFDVEEALPAIAQLVDLMEERYQAFERAQVTDLLEYNDQVDADERLERRLLIIDEFQDLIVDRASKETFFAGIRRLGAKARAAGIHLVLATQRPDRETVPPIIKANLGGKIALQVGNQTNSRIVLDQGGAEKLLGKGDLLADLGHGVVRAQGALMA
jgi:S-DNA-T family DNA segregation ATPase FtsK/SpoIIIE